MTNHPNRRFSDSKRRQALADSAGPTSRSPNGLEIALVIKLYTTIPGHSIIRGTQGKPALLNCRSDEELVREFRDLIATLRQRQRRQVPFTVTWFHDPVDDNATTSSHAATFEAALALLPSGPKGWRRYRIEQGDLFIERGDPDGPRGAPSPLRFGKPAPSNEWWAQEGDL